MAAKKRHKIQVYQRSMDETRFGTNEFEDVDLIVYGDEKAAPKRIVEFIDFLQSNEIRVVK